MARRATTLTDLPPELLWLIAEKLADYDASEKWRGLDDVVKDYCALNMAAKPFQEIAAALGEHIAEELHVELPPDPPSKIPPGLTQNSSLTALKAALREFGLKVGGSKLELWARLNAKLAVSGVAKNVVPRSKRAAIKAPRRLCATAAKKRYDLTDADLAPLEPLRKRNVYGGPMKMYTLADLRRAALSKQAALVAKHGSVAAVRQARADAKAKSAERTEKMRATVERKQVERQAELDAALLAVGCDQTSESYQCVRWQAVQFVEKGARSRRTAAGIAQEEVELRWFLEHTAYRRLRNDDSRVEYRWRGYGHVQVFGDPLVDAKERALLKYVDAGGAMDTVPQSCRAWAENVVANREQYEW